LADVQEACRPVEVDVDIVVHRVYESAPTDLMSGTELILATVAARAGNGRVGIYASSPAISTRAAPGVLGSAARVNSLQRTGKHTGSQR